LSSLEDPVRTMTVAMIAPGGDYTDPIKRAPVTHWINTLLVNASYIGDIANEEWKVDFQAHKRLIRCATKQSTIGHKKLFKAHEEADFLNRLMPKPNDLLHRYKHLQFMMEMMRKTGQPSLDLPNCRRYSYARIDKSLPLSRNNIKRCHDDDPPDDLITSEEEEEEKEEEGSCVDLA